MLVQIGEGRACIDWSHRLCLANRLDEVYECVAIYWFAEEANRTQFQVEGLGLLWGFSVMITTGTGLLTFLT
jgi:hypothetical protein